MEKIKVDRWRACDKRNKGRRGENTENLQGDLKKSETEIK